MLNRCVLAAVFTLSFATYLFGEVSTTFQIIPILLFAGLVFVRVCGRPENLNVALQSLATREAVLYLFSVSLLTAAPSFMSNSELAPGYWVLTCSVLLLSRMYMSVTSLDDVLTSFYWSGLMCVGIFVYLGYSLLFKSAETLTRLFAFAFHPNLLAFIMAGYICAFVMKALEARAVIRVPLLLLASVCGAIIFLASSRGSIVALLCGFAYLAVLGLQRLEKQTKRSVMKIAGIFFGVILASVIFLRSSPWTSETFKVIDTMLQLDQSARGLDSGLSGRMDRWDMVIGVFSKGTFLLGKGLRSSDSMDPMIDNSYLVLLYEVGLVPAILITWRFLMVIWAATKRYLHAQEKARQRQYLNVGFLLVVFMVNNIVARLLFGVGNPYSLCCMLFFAAVWYDAAYATSRAQVTA